MNLTELNNRMALGVARTDLTSDGASNYTAILNDAQKEICRAHSFNWMRAETSVTITGGASYVALPADFKELVTDNTPVWLADVESGSIVYRPVNIWTPEKVRRWQSYVAQGDTQGSVLYVDRTASPPRLSLGNGTATEAMTFKVHYYAFPTALSDSVTTNTLTADFPELLLAKAKAIAFAAINDPAVADMEKLFSLKFNSARQHDMYSRIAGTQLRM